MKKLNKYILLLFCTFFSLLDSSAQEKNLPLSQINLQKKTYQLIKNNNVYIVPQLSNAASCIWTIDKKDTAFVRVIPFGKDVVIRPLSAIPRTVILHCTTTGLDKGYQANSTDITLNLTDDYYITVRRIYSGIRPVSLYLKGKKYVSKDRKKDQTHSRFVEFKVGSQYIKNSFDTTDNKLYLKLVIPEFQRGRYMYIDFPFNLNEHNIPLQVNEDHESIFLTKEKLRLDLTHIYYGMHRNSEIQYYCKLPQFQRSFNDISDFKWISCPLKNPKLQVFDGHQKEITNEYGTSWMLYTYDTKERSINGPKKAWKEVNFPKDTLVLSHGYLLGFLDKVSTPVYIVFHSTEKLENLYFNSHMALPVTNYASQAKHPYDANWHLIGANTFQKAYITNYLVTQHYRNGSYKLERETNHIDENEAIFVQTLPLQTSIYIANSASDSRLKKCIEKTNSMLLLISDKSRSTAHLLFSQDATNRYDIGQDVLSLNKIHSKSNNGVYFQIEKQPLIRCCAPSSESLFPLILCSDTTQNFHLHYINNEEAINTCILTDSLLHKQIDLCTQSYTFKSDSGCFYSRFSISINAKIPDALSCTSSQPFYCTQEKQVMYINELPSPCTLKVFTTTGQCIYNKSFIHKKAKVYLPHRGVYICQISTKQKSYPFVWIY